MTTGFSTSADTDFFMSADSSTSASPIVFFLSSSPLLLIVLDITKLFHIRKLVTHANNTTVVKILKGIIWITKISFPSLDKAWQYMLGILDHDHRLEVTEDITHQQVLLPEKIGSGHNIMAKLLKKDWKEVEIAKKTITDLIRHI